ncbi:MAG: hypothetical protein AAFV77_08490, partial [Planctomycetota bacterium]
MRILVMSAVASVAFASCAASAQPISAFGLPHEALGQAVLRPSGDELIVSNIGSNVTTWNSASPRSIDTPSCPDEPMLETISSSPLGLNTAC